LLRAFAEVCLAMEFAHTRGVLHRDLKPSNLLLGDFGEVYILDWGVAYTTGDDDELGDHEATTPGMTGAGMTMGTPGYMAPEQIAGDVALDGRADVYALGCMLYEILAGEPLHPRGEAGMQSALDGGDARPSAIAADVPPELDELCVRATAGDRDQRVASARELGDAVQAYLDGDRDLALRRGLARDHLAEAYAGDAGGEDEEHRQVAIREAGRALALDPTLPGAADLVGRLMMEPPRTLPRAVEDELAAIDDAESRRQARIGTWLHVGYLGVALAFFALGAHDPAYLGALAALAIVNAAISYAGSRRPTRANTTATIVFNIAMIGLFARLFSPFLVAPGVGAVTLMAFASHPAVATSRRLLATSTALGMLAVLGIWAAEVSGAIAPTMTIEGASIVMTSPIAGIASVPLVPALILYAVTLIVAAALLAGSLAKLQREAYRRLHVQAWHLRQLLPTGGIRSR
jgi:serine/threonine-protein kinase